MDVKNFLTKDEAIDSLVHRIRSVALGNNVLGASQLAMLLQAFTHEESPGQNGMYDEIAKEQAQEIHAFKETIQNLPNRLNDVFILVAREALPNKLIARELELSEKTVKAYMTQILSLTGCKSRSELIRKATLAGF